VYTHAGAFVLPSSHEGLPIALLEALSYGLRVIASDIPANREVALESSSYFPVGDVDALTQALKRFSQGHDDEQARTQRMRWVAQTYNWDRVAEQTLAIYRRLGKG
jgi:glycosyltransferase involved in cell wall biosynthesis